MLFNVHLIVGVLSVAVGLEGKRRVLIVGAGERAIEVARVLSEGRSRQWEVIGLLEAAQTEGALSPGDWPILGSVDAVSEVLSQHPVDEVILALPFEARGQSVQVCRQLLDQLV